MNQALRITQRLVVSALLLCSVAMAQPTKNHNSKSAEHHSKFSKLAFWRHHNDAKKNAKTHSAASKHSQSKAAQVKPASAKQPAKTATSSAKKTTAKNMQGAQKDSSKQ